MSCTLSLDVENRSTEPAYYSICEVYVDERFERITRDDRFTSIAGTRKLRDGATNARVFQRRFMLPNDFPFIKEQIQRIATFHLGFNLVSASSLRFGIGTKVLAPGCEHEAFNTLFYQSDYGNNRMQIGNMRTAD